MGDSLLFSVGRRVDPAFDAAPGHAAPWGSLVLPRRAIVYFFRVILTSLDALDNNSFNHSFDVSSATCFSISSNDV
jgi:hypothetical protein